MLQIFTHIYQICRLQRVWNSNRSRVDDMLELNERIKLRMAEVMLSMVSIIIAAIKKLIQQF